MSNLSSKKRTIQGANRLSCEHPLNTKRLPSIQQHRMLGSLYFPASLFATGLIHIFLGSVIHPCVQQTDEQSAADVVSDESEQPVPQDAYDCHARYRAAICEERQTERGKVGDNVFEA